MTRPRATHTYPESLGFWDSARASELSGTLQHRDCHALPELEEAVPRVSFQLFQPGRQIADVERVGLQVRRQLVPTQWRCDGRARPRTGRKGAHCGRAVLIPQVIDENLAPAFCL